MVIQKSVSLKPYNTFGIEAQCDELFIIESKQDVVQYSDLLKRALILGGGSNILLEKISYPSVALNKIDHIEITKETKQSVVVSIGSGKNWHETVLWAVNNNLGGIENLSLIPGTVGAGPIQNIGAYGTELKDVLIGVDFFSFTTKFWRYMDVNQCQLGYRNSIFKNQLKNKGFIGNVYLELTKENYHHINTTYSALQNHLLSIGKKEATIEDVSSAVIEIRNSKLPDWKNLGNAGSFFKNPVVPIALFNTILKNNPSAPSYPIDQHWVKLPAAWLIQECGFKGKRIGNVGCYEKQPLVIVNFGEGTAEEIIALKTKIQTAVYNKFNVELSPEVSLV